MNQDLRFDQFQFDGKRARAVSAETGIAFSDYKHMHTMYRSQRVRRRSAEKIAWAFDDVTMRRVILTFLERRYAITVPAGASDLARVEAINFKAAANKINRKLVVDQRLDAYRQAKEDGAPPKRLRELEIEAQIADSRTMFDRRPVELTTSVVWLSYRLGMNSTQVAEQLHILPPAVRILLWRLNRVAHDLQTGRPHRVRRQKSTPKRPWSRRELVQLWFLRANGLSWSKCAIRLGRATPGGNGSKLIPIYRRHFEQTPPTKQGRWWTKENLQGL
jgi:hypothetical protein